MSKRASATAADIARVVAGVIRGGMPAGTFIIETVDKTIRVLPTTPGAALPSPDSGEAEWDKALGLQ